ncbi:hypothetical protein AQUCO_00201423v1 [Aquilegia coerulea]|uniref:Uncharacterized protein n=1 Tax=Aquilegia coerulea TaxID=218851 RepID=A0A2G5F867_AQUCA|nr:hypothetical protein AQUCO_00201423v1 [Aquilegia coerulea]
MTVIRKTITVINLTLVRYTVQLKVQKLVIGIATSRSFCNTYTCSLIIWLTLLDYTFMRERWERKLIM